MPIPVNCSCGHDFSVDDDLVDQNVDCPECGDAVQVIVDHDAAPNAPNDSTAEMVPPLASVQDSKTLPYATPRPYAPSPRPRPTALAVFAFIGAGVWGTLSLLILGNMVTSGSTDASQLMSYPFGLGIRAAALATGAVGALFGVRWAPPILIGYVIGDGIALLTGCFEASSMSKATNNMVPMVIWGVVVIGRLFLFYVALALRESAKIAVEIDRINRHRVAMADKAPRPNL